MSTGDYNNDGYDDLAVYRKYKSYMDGMKLFVFLSNGSDAFSATNWLGISNEKWTFENVKFMVAEDYDDDGNDDLAIYRRYDDNSTGMKTFVLQSNGGSYFDYSFWAGSSSSKWNLENTKEMRAGDFNNDGVADLVIFRGYDDPTSGIKVFAFLSDGASIFSSEIWSIDGDSKWNLSNVAFVNEGDVNNDGYSNLVVYRGYNAAQEGLKLVTFENINE
jgi:hypothetical protein